MVVLENVADREKEAAQEVQLIDQCLEATLTLSLFVSVCEEQRRTKHRESKAYMLGFLSSREVFFLHS